MRRKEMTEMNLILRLAALVFLTLGEHATAESVAVGGHELPEDREPRLLRMADGFSLAA